MAKETSVTIALAGNPNCGKTTLFNALTGSNQYVGNWPGVTVEKKEGRLKKHEDVVITDLPGIYSLSPYTLEEVVARNYLVGERPNAILNIIDGTNLERNLNLTTQLLELGIPVVIAINMIDVVEKNGDKIDKKALSKKLGCPVLSISALKGTGISEAAEAAIEAAKAASPMPRHEFSGPVEHALAHIEEACLHDLPENEQLWYAIKIFERDDKVIARLGLSQEVQDHIEKDREACEAELDDDTESIITNERYDLIGDILQGTYKKKNAGKLSTSDKIDRVVTNRWLALPIFIVVMFLVYYVSVSTVGTWATDWMNDGVFDPGGGWHLFGIGTSAYNDAADSYAQKYIFTPDVQKVVDAAVAHGVTGADEVQAGIESGSFADFSEAYDSYGAELTAKGYDISKVVDPALEKAPQESDFGVWVPSIPALCDLGLDKANAAPWLHSLLVDGIVGGVGAVLGFVPQIMVLFFFLAFLEGCGYMSRVAFILDRIFRKFGLSGKSFIPMLIGTGCGVPGIMASRTIENERDRRMTIMTTTFMPCSAKTPIIAMIAISLFGGAWWVAPSAYFLGMASIIISGIMLKKTKPFAGEPAPFVMELPAYHLPTPGNIWKSVWERASSFIKRAGTIILAASIVIWLGSHFGMVGGHFGYADFNEIGIQASVLGAIGGVLRYLFIPLGFGGTLAAAGGGIQATIATIMGLVAKEEVVGVFGVLDFQGLAPLAGYAFLAFNLLAAPCFAAIGAIRREMNNTKWTWFAILYQITYAYAIALMIYQFGSAIQGNIHVVPFIFAVLVLAFILFMLFRRYHEANIVTEKVDVRSKKERRAAKKAEKSRA